MNMQTREYDDSIQQFIDTEMEQTQLIVDADPFLKARFSNHGIMEIYETFSNGAFDFEIGGKPNLDPLHQWIGMRICWTTDLANEAESYNSAAQAPHEGLLEYLIACVLLCNRMIEHHTPAQSAQTSADMDDLPNVPWKDTSEPENGSTFEVHDHNTCPDCGGQLERVEVSGDYECDWCNNALFQVPGIMTDAHLAKLKRNKNNQ